MLRVVTGEDVGVERAQIERNERESLRFEAAKDLADQAALNGVGLQQNKRAIRH